MRIIAGEKRSRRLLAPEGMDTRPTADRTKEALFSILLSRLPGARVLDLYAGSGALALEALSRGAAFAVLADQSPKACRVIRQNIEALDYAVFQNHNVTMDKLISILDSNYDGEERLRQLLINRPNKFGNDNPSVDKIYRDIIVSCSDYVQQFRDSRGGQYCVSNLSQTINLLFGEFCGATPDGRLAGDPLSDNASPAGGRDISGPTATVKSVSNIDQLHTFDGTLFNLRFDPNGLEGERGTEIIEGVVKTFFDHYGEHIQINVVDDATLRKAMDNPEAYRGLVVRVAGYLAFFTDLDRNVQEDIIRRTAHSC